MEFQSQTLVSYDLSLVEYVAFFACVTLASFLAWRAVRRNPLHPEHGKRPYFWGGTVPVSRLSAAAAILGIVSLLVTVLVAYSFNGLPLVTFALAAAAVVLGAGGVRSRLDEAPVIEIVPAGAIVAGFARWGDDHRYGLDRRRDPRYGLRSAIALRRRRVGWVRRHS